MTATVWDRIDLYKTEIDKLRPFEDPCLLRQIRSFYRVDLTFTSNAMEGNSLTLSETKVLLEEGLTVGGKPMREALEAFGHGKAYDHIFDVLGKKEISARDILMLHRLFYAGIDIENAGTLRSHRVFITGSSHNGEIPAPEDLPAAMEKLESWIRENQRKLPPVVYAARLHKHIAFVHPFIDGNGRVARLAMNAVLIQNGYLPAAIPPVLRAAYLNTLEKAWDNDIFFLEFIANRVLETEKDFLRMMGIAFPDRDSINL
jgi:Fic family protein